MQLFNKTAHEKTYHLSSALQGTEPPATIAEKIRTAPTTPLMISLPNAHNQHVNNLPSNLYAHRHNLNTTDEAYKLLTQGTHNNKYLNFIICFNETYPEKLIIEALRYVGFTSPEGAWIILIEGQNHEKVEFIDKHTARQRYWNHHKEHDKNPDNNTGSVNTGSVRFIAVGQEENFTPYPTHTVITYNDFKKLLLNTQDNTKHSVRFDTVSDMAKFMPASKLATMLAEHNWELSLNHIDYERFPTITNKNSISGEQLIELATWLETYEYGSRLFADNPTKKQTVEIQEEVRVRLESGMKQNTIAQELKISPATVSRIVKNLKN